MALFALIITLAAVVASPFLAAKIMRLEGGVGKSAIVALVTLGATQIIGMIAQHLGPLGGLLGFMGALAAWYQVVRVVYGTDTAHTMVFMFWHLFFQLLTLSLLAMWMGASRIAWVWGG